MNRKKSIILCAVALVVACAMFVSLLVTLFSYRSYDFIASETGVYDEDGNDLTGGTRHELPRLMSFTAESVAVAAAKGESVDVRITANVKPATAANKLVDYDVYWATGSSHMGSEVTDYLDVEQDYDGSPEATVHCYKAFGSDKIIISVTTRVGGFTDLCTVSFVGRPSEIIFTSAANNMTSNNGLYALGEDGEYTFNMSASSPLWTVGGSYKDFELVSVRGSDQEIVLCDKYTGSFNPSGSSVHVAEGTEQTVTFRQFLEGFTYTDVSGTYTLQAKLGYNLNIATVSGTQLMIKTGKGFGDALNAYIGKDVAGSMGSHTYYGCFKEVVDGTVDDLYLIVTVREKTSGVTGELKVNVKSGMVTGVELSDRELTF